MKTKLFLLVLIFLLSPIYAQTIDIQPETFEINLTGGDLIYKNLTITASGFEAPIVANISAEIKADKTNSEGFEVNFSENQFVLNNNQPKIIQMIIYTKPEIEPDSFEIEIIVKTYIPTEIQTVYKSRGGSRTRIIYIENKSNLTCDNRTIFVPVFVNQTEEVEKIVNQTVFVENTTRIGELEKKVDELYDAIIYAIVLLFLLGLVIFYLLFREKIKLK